MGKNNKKNPLQYPANSQEFQRRFIFNRRPTEDDLQEYRIGDMWIVKDEEETYSAFVLIGKSNRRARWQQMGETVTDIIRTISGSAGTKVRADDEANLSLQGTGGITVTENVNNHSLVIGNISAPIETINNVQANESANLTIKEGNNVTITENPVGNSLEITADDSVKTINTIDPTPEGNFTVQGQNGISVTAGTNSITLEPTLQRIATINNTAPSAQYNMVLSGTMGITISENPATNTITVSGQAQEFPWTEITVPGDAQNPTQMQTNNGYITNSDLGIVNLLLPTTSAIADRIKISNKGSSGFIIRQNAGQQIHFLTQSATPGNAGSIQSSTTRYIGITLRCITANTEWIIDDGRGPVTAS